jgi:hypothetical protein
MSSNCPIFPDAEHVTALLVYFIGGMFGRPEILLTYLQGFGETIIFLVVSYVVGHVVQGRGRMIEQKEKDVWGGYFSVQFLRHDNSFYSPDFKNMLKKAAQSQFGLAVDLAGNEVTQEQKDKRHQEVFELCYALVVQKGISGQVEIHNATYGMFRASLAAREVGIFLAAIAAIRHASLLGIYWYASGLAYYEPESTNLIISLLILVLLLGIGSFLKARLRHFAQRFVDSVYRNFAVYEVTKEER